MIDVACAVLMGSGVGLLVIAAIGLLRFPDPYCRAHAVAKAVTLGIALVLLGAWARLGTEAAGMKLGLAIVFQMATLPLAGQLLARAAYTKNVRRWRGTPSDDGRS